MGNSTQNIQYSIGLQVSARYNGNQNKYYLATIVKKHTYGRYDVKFASHGNIQTIFWDDIKPVPYPIIDDNNDDINKKELSRITNTISIIHTNKNVKNYTKNTKNISIEDIISKQIQSLLLSPNTSEGKYRNIFIQKFETFKANDDLLELIRDFMNFLNEKILKIHGDKYKKMLLKSWKTQAKYRNDILNKLIESAIETDILQLKIREIYQICSNRIKSISEYNMLLLMINKLYNFNQLYFGIKKELISSTNWKDAIYELSLFRIYLLPSKKINVLINCVHTIYSSSNSSNPSCFITGDDLLPIIIYIIVQLSKKKIYITDADLIFIEGLVDPNTIKSESGYYLAVFHAALHWIKYPTFRRNIIVLIVM